MATHPPLTPPRRQTSRGFALLETLIVLSLCALLSTHAAAPIARARRSANEQRVRALLREIHLAQIQRSSATGEFGYFSELELNGGVTRLADDVISHADYVFRIWIADERLAGLDAAQDLRRESARQPYYAVLAWPRAAGDWSGRTVYFASESGQIAAMSNQAARGTRTRTPSWHVGYVEAAMNAHPRELRYVGADGHTWELLP